jgi:putative endonuclease
MRAGLRITRRPAFDNPLAAVRAVGIATHCGRMTTEKASEAEKSQTRIQLGALGEALAVDHLTKSGLWIVNRNWRCRYGELDVIAADEATRTLVFVEVKTRTGDGYGGLAHAVTPRKVRRLRRLAGLWLAAQDEHWAAIRIDVIGVRVGRRRTPEITHLQGVG